MKKILSVLAILVPTMIGAPVAAEKLSLATLSTYLNTLGTVQADFTQINDDGSISTGDLFISRPGRIRFEYNPPDKSLVMASEGQVAVFDLKSNQAPEKFPLARTPLSLILANTVNLAAAKMVVGHKEDGATTVVTAQDPKYPEYGHIQMVFTEKPTELRQWIVTDGSGQDTTVILGAFTTGISLSPRIFDISEEMKTRGY
jgi:outer membrane lipoprotein-sorting protein